MFCGWVRYCLWLPERLPWHWLSCVGCSNVHWTRDTPTLKQTHLTSQGTSSPRDGRVSRLSRAVHYGNYGCMAVHGAGHTHNWLPCVNTTAFFSFPNKMQPQNLDLYSILHGFVQKSPNSLLQYLLLQFSVAMKISVGRLVTRQLSGYQLHLILQCRHVT